MPLQALVEDLRVAVPPQRFRPLRVAFSVVIVPRIRALVDLRVGQLLYRRGLRPLATILQARVLRYSGADINCGAVMGPGLSLVHSSGVVIGDKVVAGAHLRVFQGVTLGDRGMGEEGQPTIGDDVTIFAGALVLGPITLGDRVVVAANSLVLSDVPADHLAYGAPAVSRPLSDRSSSRTRAV